MTKNKPTSYKIFIVVILIISFVFLTATLFSHYQVDKKYSMLLAFFMFVALAFTTVGIYSGFKLKVEDSKLKRNNLVGLIGNLLIFLFTLVIMGYAALTAASAPLATNKIDHLLCKKWKPIAYEEEGKKYDAPEKFQTTRMNFCLDHTVESTDKGNSAIGDWIYDENIKTITIIDKVTKEITIIKIKNITENELVVLAGKPEERMLTLYMQPDLDK